VKHYEEEFGEHEAEGCFVITAASCCKAFVRIYGLRIQSKKLSKDC
jgi:hypothetical protein